MPQARQHLVQTNENCSVNFQALIINDAGWRQFRSYLEYFANKYGKVALAARLLHKPAVSTMRHDAQKVITTRTHTCKCGCVLQRDHAAAINILRKGKEKIATSGHGGSWFLNGNQETLRELKPLFGLVQTWLNKFRR